MNPRSLWICVSLDRRQHCCEQAEWNPLNAVRMGEAKNPGPGCADGDVRICVTHVGSISNKMDHVCNLLAHVVCIVRLSTEVRLPIRPG